jgi:hypothetical protein
MSRSITFFVQPSFHTFASGDIYLGDGEVQRALNQKVGSKSSETVDFISRFILLIDSKFKIHTFNNHYES